MTQILSRFLEPVESLEEDQRQCNVDQHSAREVQRLGKGRHFKQCEPEADKDEAMNEDQGPGEEGARKRMFQVELNAAPCSHVPHQSLGHTKHSDVAVGECILQETDSYSWTVAEDSVAFQRSKVDEGQKRNKWPDDSKTQCFAISRSVEPLSTTRTVSRRSSAALGRTMMLL